MSEVRYITYKQEDEILAKMQERLDELVAEEEYELAQFLLDTMNDFKKDMIQGRITKLERDPIHWIGRNKLK
jgi:protein-arginine kinase activator protein McsA